MNEERTAEESNGAIPTPEATNVFDHMKDSLNAYEDALVVEAIDVLHSAILRGLNRTAPASYAANQYQMARMARSVFLELFATPRYQTVIRILLNDHRNPPDTVTSTRREIEKRLSAFR